MFISMQRVSYGKQINLEPVSVFGAMTLLPLQRLGCERVMTGSRTFQGFNVSNLMGREIESE